MKQALLAAHEALEKVISTGLDQYTHHAFMSERGHYLREALALIDSALSDDVKDGYVLVPVEPTKEMQIAGRKFGAIDNIYRAMIAAAQPDQKDAERWDFYRSKAGPDAPNPFWCLRVIDGEVDRLADAAIAAAQKGAV